VERTDPKMISSWAIEIGNQSISFFPYVYQFADEAKTCGGYVSDPVWHANARLIEAAPDMFDVLETIVRVADGRRIPGNLILDENSPLMGAARDALAKARGN